MAGASIAQNGRSKMTKLKNRNWKLRRSAAGEVAGRVFLWAGVDGDRNETGMDGPCRCRSCGHGVQRSPSRVRLR